jgi:menaquinone-dependent protoporphyrinogen IX oxidase
MTRTAGGDTDTHRDYVYTDWNDILVFAQQIDSMIKLGAQESHISTE